MTKIKAIRPHQRTNETYKLRNQASTLTREVRGLIERKERVVGLSDLYMNRAKSIIGFGGQ